MTSLLSADILSKHPYSGVKCACPIASINESSGLTETLRV